MEMGRAIIKLESAIASCPFRDDKEKEDYLAYLYEHLGPHIRQDYLRWTNNREVERRKAAESATIGE